LPGLGFRTTRQIHLVKQDLAQLLGRTDIEVLPGQLLDFCFECCRALRQFARQPRQDLPVNLDAALLHSHQNRCQRPLEPLVDACHAFRNQPYFQDMPKPECHFGIFGRISGCLVDRHLRKRDRVLARAGHILVADCLVAQPALRKRIHAMPALARIEHIGQQHGVIETRNFDVVLRHHQHVVFEVLPDLENRGILEQRLEFIKCGASASAPAADRRRQADRRSPLEWASGA
jgi:hypothetical protein